MTYWANVGLLSQHPQTFSVPQQHVQDGRKETFDGYVTTFSKALPPDGNGGVFALDCEMVSQTGFYLLNANLGLCLLYRVRV